MAVSFLGFEYRLCFKDIEEGTCKYESFVGEWEFKRDGERGEDEDCCNSDGAAYYIDVTEHYRLTFRLFGVGKRPCAPCKKFGKS